MLNTFIHRYTFRERHSECLRIMNNYPDRIPIICEKQITGTSVNSLRLLDKVKYLVPQTMTVVEFIFVIKKRLRMRPIESLFFMSNGIMLSGNSYLQDIYERHKSTDGFLYIVYTEENVFG